MFLLLKDGLIFDGSGGIPQNGSVLIDDDRIVEVGPGIQAPQDAGVVECNGLAIAPGFVDIHSHSDLHLLINGPEKLQQGVTTEVVGNCGFSAFPSCRHAARVHEYANPILNGGNEWGWESSREYLEQAIKQSTIANVYSLTGHGTLRVAQSGFRQGPLEAEEADAMAGTLGDCIAGGSVGFSTGLMYAPGSSAPFEELTELCNVTARNGGIYCTHMRSYSWELLESLEEQILLARLTGCRLQISHLQAVGRLNWEKQDVAFERMESARREGVDIEFDIYPYQAGSTVLSQLLPQRALAGGTADLIRRLHNAAERKDIARETQASLAQSWTDVIIASVGSAKNQPIVGLSIAAIAFTRELPPAEAVLDLLIEEEAVVNIVAFNQSEGNLRGLLTHPQCTVISDGFYVNGRPHPRLFGTFPELLGRYCRDQHWLTLPEAIHKITQKPAERFGLKGRGTLRRGAFADVTLFDPNTIRSKATYDDPERRPEGIHLVLRNGREVYRSDNLAA